MHFNTETLPLQSSSGRLACRKLAVTVILVVAVTMGASTGCSAQNKPVVPISNVGSAITITEKDAGKSIAMVTGQTLIALFPSNPSTGYQWMVQGSPAPLELATSNFAGDPQRPNVPGAGGTQQLQLTAKAAGTVELTFEYRRPWEKDVSPAKTVMVRVVVK